MKEYNSNILLVYEKQGISKVLSLQEDKETYQDLINKGWKHVSTIQPQKYIEYLLNNNKIKNK
jgi:hypothetical protein